MKLFILPRLVTSLFANLSKIFSGEPTTERDKTTALLLALRSAQNIILDIVEERIRFNRAFSEAQPIERRKYPFICNSGPAIRRLMHWINKAHDLLTTLSEEELQNSAGEECADIIEWIAKDENISVLHEALESTRTSGNVPHVALLERSLSDLLGAFARLPAAA
jgi:hypothetical protein